MTPETWHTLRPGDGADVIVAVSFGPGVRQRGFGALAPHLETGATLIEPTFAASENEQTTDPVRCCHAWLTDLRHTGWVVAGVVGFCAGAALSQLFATTARQFQPDEPVSVLLDPGYVNFDGVRHEYTAAVTSLAEGLTDDELNATLAAAVDPTGQDAVGRRRLVRDLLSRYRSAVARAAGRLGIDKTIEDQIFKHTARYIWYLLLCLEAAELLARRNDSISDPIVMASSDYRPPPGFAGQVCRVFTCPQAKLLEDPEVGSALSALMTRRAG